MTIAATSSHERMALRTMSASFGRHPWGPARTAGYDRRVKPGNSHDAAQRFNRGRPGTPVSSRGAEYFTIEALQAELGNFSWSGAQPGRSAMAVPARGENSSRFIRAAVDRSGFAQPGKNFPVAACNASKMKYFGSQPSIGPWGVGPSTATWLFSVWTFQSSLWATMGMADVILGRASGQACLSLGLARLSRN